MAQLCFDRLPVVVDHTSLPRTMHPLQGVKSERWCSFKGGMLLRTSWDSMAEVLLVADKVRCTCYVICDSVQTSILSGLWTSEP